MISKRRCRRMRGKLFGKPRRIFVSRETYEWLLRRLAEPPAPTPALVELLAMHKRVTDARWAGRADEMPAKIRAIALEALEQPYEAD